MAGTVPHHQLLKIKAASTPAANKPSDRPTQEHTAARTQSRFKVASTPSNTSNGKQGSAVRTQSLNTAFAASPKKSSSAKPTQVVNMAGSTPNSSNGRSAQVNPAHTSVNMAISTRQNAPVAQLSEVNSVRSSTARIATPTGTNPGNKVQTPTVLLQVGNTTTPTANPNAMPQQVIRLPSNLLANLTGNNTVQNVVTRTPGPRGAIVSTTPGSVRNTVPSPRPITTVAHLASSTSGSVQTASTAVVSSSSAMASAKTSKGSRA